MKGTAGDYDQVMSMFGQWQITGDEEDASTFDPAQLIPMLQLKLASTSSEFDSISDDADTDRSSNSDGSGSNPHSAPQSPKRTGRRPSVNPTRFKTELCRPFQETGVCRYGNKCQFAHGPAEMRGVPRHPKYKTEMCRTYHTTGLCPYGPRCHFIHDENDQKLQEISDVKKKEIAKQAVKEMAQLHARQQLIQGRVGMIISQLQQKLIVHNFWLQMKQVKAAQRVAKQLATSQEYRSISLDSTGETPPATPMCSSPPVFDVPSTPCYALPPTPCYAVPPPPGFQSSFFEDQPQVCDLSQTDIAASRLPIFSQFTSEQ